MKVGITGASGFIGQSLLAECLRREWKVKVLTRDGTRLPFDSDKVKIVIGDLTQLDSLYEFTDELDVLFHCAGEIKEESKMHSIHVDGMNNLMLAAKNRIKHWVQLSSVGVYGAAQSGLVTEDSLLKPVGEYEKTKCISDELLIEKSFKSNFTYSILRPSNVFGKKMRNQSLFNLISMIDKKLFFYIGNADAISNYVHVDNVTAALMLCAINKKAHGNVYNISTCVLINEFVSEISIALNLHNHVYTMPEFIARLIAKTIGRFPGFPLKESRVDALIKKSAYSTKKICEDLNYTPVISLPESVRQTVREWKIMTRNT